MVPGRDIALDHGLRRNDGRALPDRVFRHAVNIDLPLTELPSHLGIVNLAYDSTDTIEITLRRIAHGDTAYITRMLQLRHFWHKIKGTHHIATAKTNRELTAIVANLGIGHATRQQEYY